MLVAVSAVLYLVALVNDAFTAYLLWWGTVCLLVAAYVYARRSLRGISLTRQFAGGRIFQHDPRAMALTLHHQPGASQVVLIRDPVHSLTRGTTEELRYVIQAEPGRTGETLRRDVSFPLRGHYQLGPMVMEGSDPAGIFVRSLQAGQPAEVIVYPRPLPLSHIYLQGLSSYHLSELRTAPMAGATQEFYGIRPYQQGDDLRRIHWKSTARTGRLAIKEYEQRVSAAATVVLDLHQASQRGTGAQSTLEYAVVIAASLAQHVIDHGKSLSLMTTGADSFLLPMDRGEHQLHKAFEQLAVARADGAADFASALASRLHEIPAASTVLVITASSDPHLVYPLLMLRGAGAHVTAVLIAAHTFAEVADPRAEAVYGQLVSAALGAADAICPVRRGDDIASALGAARLWL